MSVLYDFSFSHLRCVFTSLLFLWACHFNNTKSVNFRVSCCVLFVIFQVHGPAVVVNFAVNMFSEL
jgi:hypothetical protein